MKTAWLLTAVAVALLAVAACGTDGQAGPTPDPPPASPSPAAGNGDGAAIEIFDFGYRPATAEVSAGTTITWTNTGSAPHTVTFEDGPDSGELASGATFEHAFDEAGPFSYLCAIHPAMRGVVNVSP